MNEYSLHAPGDVALRLAASIRDLRLSKGWKQTTLADRSGVTLASLRRFESTGRVSLRNMLRLAFALNRLDDFLSVLKSPVATSMAELEALDASRGRKRGRI